MNASTTRCCPAAADQQAAQRSCAPFAALPHDIAADPRLSPTDVRVLLALLFYARSKPACWPSDATIGSRVGRSVSTVQRSLRRLQALGLVDRIPDESEANRTGRRIVLAWRGRLTPASSVTDPPASPMTDEGRREREQERPESAAGVEGPPPPAGDEGTEPDLATLHQWAEGADPILRKIAGRRLAELAAETGAAATAEPPLPSAAEADMPPRQAGSSVEARPPGPAPANPRSGQVRPLPPPAIGSGLAAPGSRRCAGPTYPDYGLRQVLERLAVVATPTVLPAWVARSSP